MRKSTRIVKRLLALFLVVLMSIESFGAVVSDNDGSAFITKAEFDSLKNNFQSQIDRYNTSIDSKIDGAIASYLSGIKVDRKTTIDPLVEKYKDLYWCHDFSIYSIKRTWTAKNTSSADAVAVLQPDYSNREGWVYWMTDRGVRTAWFDQNMWGHSMFSIRFLFESDNDGPTRTSQRQGEDNGNPTFTLNTDNNWVIDSSTPIFQFTRIFYLWRVFGNATWGSGHGQLVGDWMNEDPASKPAAEDWHLSLEPATPIENDYVSLYWHVTTIRTSDGKMRDYRETLRFGPENCEAFPFYMRAYSTEDAWWENSDKCTYPLYTYRAPINNQATADKQRIANMMIGTNTTYKMPIMFNAKAGGRTGVVPTKEKNYYYKGFNDTDWTEYGTSPQQYFPTWDNWNKKTIQAVLDFPENVDFTTKSTTTMTPGGWSSVYWPMRLYDSTRDKVTLNIPVTTLFNINKVKSPTAVYKSKNLNICGGIPIAENITKSGQLEVKIKCEKKYDNVSATSDPTDTNAHIQFKKSDFTNTSSDYCDGTYTGNTSVVTFNDSQTIDIADKTFLLNVEKGNTVWLNIDPITLGQHIKINSMEVTLITE